MSLRGCAVVDAPWCEIKPSHAAYRYIDVSTVLPSRKRERFVMGETVKGRCEPCHIVHVAQAVAAIKGVSVADVAAAAHASSMAMFFPEVAGS